jgi:hypothetical protein
MDQIVNDKVERAVMRLDDSDQWFVGQQAHAALRFRQWTKHAHAENDSKTR